MAYQKKTWKDRSTQYPNRIKVINTQDDLDEELLFITRQDAEGTVTVAGDAFSAANMNDLENRVAAAFSEASGLLSTLLGRIYPVGSVYFTMDNQCSETWLRNKFGQSTSWQSLGAAYSGRFLTPANSAGVTIGNNVVFQPNGSILQSKSSKGTWQFHGSVNSAFADLYPHSHTFHNGFGQWNYGSELDARAPKTKFDSNKHKNVDTDKRRTHYSTWQLPGGYNGHEYSERSSTSSVGGYSQHSHDFGENGWVRGNLSVPNFNIDISQPYRTVYAWRRTQ